MGLLDKKDWQGQWIADAELASFADMHASAPAAMLRKSFDPFSTVGGIS
jgi:hypothetical protein